MFVEADEDEEEDDDDDEAPGAKRTPGTNMICFWITDSDIFCSVLL